MPLRCTICGEEPSGSGLFPAQTEGKQCNRDLTDEVNELLEIQLPPKFVICPGLIEHYYA